MPGALDPAAALACAQHRHRSIRSLKLNKGEPEPFLRAMLRRLERDRNRVHAYHDDLRRMSLKRLAALGVATGKRAQNDRRRETLRVAAVEREYRGGARQSK